MEASWELKGGREGGREAGRAGDRTQLPSLLGRKPIHSKWSPCGGRIIFLFG